MWKRDEAIKFIEKLEPFLAALQFHCGLTGSILYRGDSEKDLDIIIYPHDKGGENQPTKDDAWMAIKLFCKEETHGICGGLSQIRDKKDVRWLSARGKRIDFFFLD